MSRSSRRFLAVGVCAALFIMGSTAFAQDTGICAPSCDQGCTGDPPTRRICNEELVGVRGFVANVFETDAAGELVLDADGNCILLDEGTMGRRLCTPNLAVAAILSRLDIDGDGVPDNSPDTDGDGLSDNWESGGLEALTAAGDEVDRVVFFSAPSAIVPGTPPTPIFTRLAVATAALNPDTDGDGLTDYVEVFGLMFIDENRNGRLDGITTDCVAAGRTNRGAEWCDKNGDGLPSPGEFPLDNSGIDFPQTVALLHDFDGFVFTDPFNPDTDGDGVVDGADNDPLINPRSFGNTDPIIVRFNALGNADIDQDGLGNGMDMGNDLVSTDGPGVVDFQVIDNPENVRELLDLFRQDLLDQNIVPESAIEDLLGADWDGNGLWRTTDVRTWSLVIDPASPATTPPADLFTVEGESLFATQTFAELDAVFNDDATYLRYSGRGIGMGWQDLLTPTGRTPFIPEDRVWTILYSWRLPGFDIDGDGFIGVPNASNTQRNGNLLTVALDGDPTTGEFVLSDSVVAQLGETPFDDRIAIAGAETPDNGIPGLDGQITVPGGLRFAGCGIISIGTLLLMVLGLCAPRFLRRR